MAAPRRSEVKKGGSLRRRGVTRQPGLNIVPNNNSLARSRRLLNIALVQVRRVIGPCHLLPGGTIATMSPVIVSSSHGISELDLGSYAEFFTHKEFQRLQSCLLKVEVWMTDSIWRMHDFRRKWTDSLGCI